MHTSTKMHPKPKKAKKTREIAFLMAPYWEFVWNLKFREAISRVPGWVRGSRLFLVIAHTYLYKNAPKTKKCQKSREIAFFVGPPLGICLKPEISGGHISSTRVSWRVPFVSGDSPCFPLQKRQKVKKLAWGSHMGGQFRGGGLKIPKISNISSQAQNFWKLIFAVGRGS